MNGVIKALVVSERSGNYGFIIDENNQDRYFNGKNVINVEFGSLRRGDKVTFKPTTGGKNNEGLRAVDVSPCD